jgi:hypothetical protein
MNSVEKMNQARRAQAALAPAKRRHEIDEGQYLLDKAQRLAEEAAKGAPEEEPPQPPAESAAARQARLIAVLNAAHARGAG